MNRTKKINSSRNSGIQTVPNLFSNFQYPSGKLTYIAESDIRSMRCGTTIIIYYRYVIVVDINMIHSWRVWMIFYLLRRIRGRRAPFWLQAIIPKHDRTRIVFFIYCSFLSNRQTSRNKRAVRMIIIFNMIASSSQMLDWRSCTAITLVVHLKDVNLVSVCSCAKLSRIDG